MKKLFPLRAPGKDDARVRDKIRHEVNKYVSRERQKKLPEGLEQWNFNCKLGASAAVAETLPLKSVGATIEEVAATGATEIFIEIVAVAGQRRFGA